MTKFFLHGAVLLALSSGCADAFAQRPQGPGGGDGRMSREERQRLREDMNSARRDVYKDAGQRRGAPPPAGGRMSDAERERLRRDVMDANRGMRRRGPPN